MTDSAIQLEKTKTYDMPLSKLDYEYISKCDDSKELEKIIKILRSGEEGHYPDMEQMAMDKLETINPKSRILRKENPVVKSKDLTKEEKKEIDEEMQDFLTSIKSKEVDSGDSELSGNTSLPPIRKGHMNMTTKQQESKPQHITSSSKKSAMPRSYKEWDKIDIDNELENAEKEDINQERRQNGSAYVNKKIPDIPLEVDATGLSNEERCLRADREKDKGNEAFRCGDYEESVIYYSRSLSLIETTNTYNNRALSYIKLSKWKEAIEDCDEVLDEEPQNIKGLLRRSISSIALEDYDSAERDLNDVLLHYPNNKLAYEKLKVCENARKELEKKKKEKKLKGRRMVIEETDGSDDQDDEQSNDKAKTVSEEQTKKEEIPQYKQNGHDDSVDRAVINEGKINTSKTSATETKKPVQPKKEKVKDIWSLDEIENFVNVNTDANLEAMSMGVSNPTTLPEKPANIRELDSDENDKETEEIEVEKPTPLTITEITDEDEQGSKITSSIAEEANRNNTNQETHDGNGSRSETTPLKQKSPSPEKLELPQTGEKVEVKSEVITESVPVETISKGAYSNRTVYKQEKLPPRLVSVKEEGSTLFRAGQYGKAILRYSNLIDELEKDENQKVNLSLMYSNRAACYLKTGHYKAVMKDCQRSLDIIPHAIKPLLRRAAACEYLEKFSHAYIDYKHILSIDSSLTVAQSGASRCQSMLQELDGQSWRDKLPPMKTAAPWEVPEIILDVSNAQSASAREFASPPPEDLPNPDVEFDECKKLGNNHVQKNEFDKAVECYSKCVKLSPDNPVGFTNRAHCYLKLQQYKEAVNDCNKALELDASNTKALYRRALARKALKQYKESLQDLSEVLKLDPKNSAALKEFDVIKMSYKEELIHIKETTPPVEQTKKKARRIPIEEVEEETLPETVQGSCPESKSTQKSAKAKRRDGSKTSESDSRKSSEEPQERNAAQKHDKNKNKGKMMEDAPSEKTAADSKVAQKSSLSKKEEMKQIEEELEWLEPKQTEAQLSKSAKRRQKAKAKKLGVGEALPEESETVSKSTSKDKCSINTSDKSMKKAKSDKEQPNGSTTTSGSKLSKKTKDTQRKTESEAVPETDAQLKCSDQISSTEGTMQSKPTKKKKGKQEKVTGLPKTASVNLKKINATPYEFMAAWNSLKTCKESKPYSEILKQIPPQQLPTVISNKLEGPMLNMILKCVKQDFVANGDHDVGYKILNHLSKVPRFSTVSMFLSSDEKKELSGVFTDLSQTSSTEYSQNDLDLLKKVYNIH